MADKKEVRREVNGDSTKIFYDDDTMQEFLALRDPENTTRMEIIKNKLGGREDVLDEILGYLNPKVAKKEEEG